MHNYAEGQVLHKAVLCIFGVRGVPPFVIYPRAPYGGPLGPWAGGRGGRDDLLGHSTLWDCGGICDTLALWRNVASRPTSIFCGGVSVSVLSNYTLLCPHNVNKNQLKTILLILRHLVYFMQLVLGLTYVKLKLQARWCVWLFDFHVFDCYVNVLCFAYMC